MVELAQLKNITAQKRLVQAQSELCRKAVQLEWEALRIDTAWVGRGVDWLHRYRTLLLVLAAPVGGVLLARHRAGLRHLFLRGFAVWQLVRRARTFTSWFRRRR